MQNNTKRLRDGAVVTVPWLISVVNRRVPSTTDCGTSESGVCAQAAPVGKIARLQESTCHTNTTHNLTTQISFSVLYPLFGLCDHF